MVQERPNRIERRLLAILAADVAGYSRLMHNDEEAAHARLTILLTDAVEPSIAEHGGRIVKNTGDGLLAEFRSAVEAVRAAMQFQERVHDLTIADADEKRLAFRVGINIGDVIVEPHDIFGDGVNIAARLNIGYGRSTPTPSDRGETVAGASIHPEHRACELDSPGLGPTAHPPARHLTKSCAPF